MDLKRANKITSYWENEGTACGIYYKTHEKMATVRSTDKEVADAGFVMPEGTNEAPITAAQKLDAFKTFLATNSTVFGITYDPVDRRADEFKFPNKYDEATFKEYAAKVLKMSVEGVLEQVNKSVITKMVAGGHMAEGSIAQYALSEPVIDITEKYANGNIKYASASFQVAFAVGAAQMQKEIKVEMVSGQIKKPRQIGDVVMTMTGIKGMFVENGLLPKIEPKSTKSADSEVDGQDAPAE